MDFQALPITQAVEELAEARRAFEEAERACDRALKACVRGDDEELMGDVVVPAKLAKEWKKYVTSIEMRERKYQVVGNCDCKCIRTKQYFIVTLKTCENEKLEVQYFDNEDDIEYTVSYGWSSDFADVPFYEDYATLDDLWKEARRRNFTKKDRTYAIYSAIAAVILYGYRHLAHVPPIHLDWVLKK